MTSDLALTIRMELFRLNLKLSVTQAEGLIQSLAECYQFISKDTATHGSIRQDFFDLGFLDGVAILTIYRKSEAEAFVFAADESLIHEADGFAMTDVAEVMEMARRRFQIPATGLRFSLSELSKPLHDISVL